MASFDFSKGRAGGGGMAVEPRTPSEPTAEEKAQHAANVAGNLDRYQRAVTEGVAAMIVAEKQQDLVGWQRAQRHASLGLVQLREAAQSAVAMQVGAADAQVSQRLVGAADVVADMEQKLASAPPAPEKRAPALSCEGALLAALPPDAPVGGGGAHAVFEGARRAVEAVMRGEMTFSDIQAFSQILREFPSHEVARRFRRFGAEKQGALSAVLQESKVRARARAREEAIKQAAAVTMPPAGFTPPTIDMPAEYEEQRATIELGGAAAGDPGAAAEPAAEPATDAQPDPEGAVARATGTAMDMPAVYEEQRATTEIVGRDAAPAVGAEEAAPGVGPRDLEGAVARANGTAMDMPAVYEEQRATIEVGGGDGVAATPRSRNPEGAVARATGTAIDMPAVYEEQRATIEIGGGGAAARSREPEGAVTQENGTARVASSAVRASEQGGLRDGATPDIVERTFSQLDAQIARLPVLARSLQTSVGYLEVDGVISAGMRLMEALDSIENDLSAQAQRLELVGGGADASNVPMASALIAPLRERQQQLAASLLVYKQALPYQCSPATFRFEPIPGVAPLSPPSFAGAAFLGFLQHEIARTTVLVSTVDEIRGSLAMLEPGGEPSRSVVDLVERWMGDRAGFLFLRHVLGTLGLSAILNASTRNGQTVDARAEAIARGVPQLSHQIVETFEVAREIHDSANPAFLIPRQAEVADPRAVATEMVSLAMERMRELGASPQIREAIQAGGGGGWSQGGVAEIIQLAEERVAALQLGLRQGVKNATGLFNQAINAVRVAATGAYPLATGEMGFAQSPLAGIDERAGLGVGDEVATAMLLLPLAAEIALSAPAIIASLTIQAAKKPELALEVVMFAATLGYQIGEDGVQGFLESLTTAEGIVQLVADILAMKQAAGPERARSPHAHVDDVGGVDAGSAGSRVFDIGARIKAKLHSWGNRLRPGEVGVTADGSPVRIDDGKSTDQVYESRLAEIRQGAVSAGSAFFRPGPQLRRAAYHPPDPDASVADLAQQLANESRAETPVLASKDGLKALSNEERAAAFQKQVDYFDHVERQARHRQSHLRLQGDPEAPDAPQWLREEYEGAKRLEAAAKIKPVAGKLPQNYGRAASELSIDEIRERTPDPDLAEAAIREIEARGLSGIRYTESGRVDMEPFIYRQGGVVGDVTISLNGKRTPDFRDANAKMREQDPDWKQPDDWTWHHHEQEGRMVLVPTSVHRVAGHTGGAAEYRHRTGDLTAYSKGSKG